MPRRAPTSRARPASRVRFAPGAGRIFFDGDAEARRGLIGYTGVSEGGERT
ncbi:hypothetical protein [Sorangium sp. So ce385]|uniref:hypothetical protein n=1 Tax=Sorangium sp. So ce385 TaxID=3133308 RepID=UPI003F5B8770